MASKSKNDEIIARARTLKGTPWCDEYEKMISGMLYNPLEPKLCEGRHRARALAFKYNNIDPGTVDYETGKKLREELLQEMLGSVGEGTFIEPPFLPDYGSNVSIGKNCFMNFNLTILDTSLVIIGDRVQIANGVTLAGAGHETSVLSRIKFIEFGHPIRIEEDCWIGANVTVLPGVTIGKGCTIGAGSVVTRDIPPYSVAVGAPARVIKKLPTVEEERADPNNPLNHMEDRE